MWSSVSQLLQGHASRSASRIPSMFQHVRNSTGNTLKALEYIAKGFNAITEVDRVVDHTDPEDERLRPLLKTAKENFEMALEVDNRNTNAMLWLGRLHLNYYIPGACTDVGAALLTEAAELGNADAQYELACQFRRAEDGLVDSEDKALYYLESAACQLHPKALFLMGAIYLGGDTTQRDVKAAAWCFRKAAREGHAAAATVYGALMAKGLEEIAKESQNAGGAIDISEKSDTIIPEVNEQLTASNQGYSNDKNKLARDYFQMAVEAGDELALEWLDRLPNMKKD